MFPPGLVGSAVGIAVKAVEIFAGHALADEGFCVSRAMADFLGREMGVSRNVTVLHDRPPRMFRPSNATVAHELFNRVRLSLPGGGGGSENWSTESAFKTSFTELDETGRAVWRDDCPVLIVSGTSWTPDEDFGILLSALEVRASKYVAR